jgi:hypothetical protein
MKKIKNDSVNDQRDKPLEKSVVVFLKMYAKRRGKYTGWGDVRAETYPTKEIKPGADYA